MNYQDSFKLDLMYAQNFLFLHFYAYSILTRTFFQNFELAPLAFAMVALLGMVFGLSLTLFGAYHFYLACINR